MAAIRGENVWKGVAAGAIAGAIADLTIATAGTGTVALVTAGALSGAAGSAADQYFNTGSVDAGQVALGAALGGGLGYIGAKLAPIIGKAAGLFRRTEIGIGKTSGQFIDDAVEIGISKSKYPQAAQHAQDAIDNGIPNTGRIDRTGAAARRRQAMKGTKAKPNVDRDEFPPAVLDSGGNGASVRYIPPGDNRGAGSSMGSQMKTLPDGTKVRVVVVE